MKSVYSWNVWFAATVVSFSTWIVNHACMRMYYDINAIIYYNYTIVIV